MEHIEKCHTIKVWFERDEWRLWAVTWHDKEGNQLGESEWYAKKCEAVDTAIAYLDSDRCDMVCVNLRDGKLQFVETKSSRISIEYKK